MVTIPKETIDQVAARIGFVQKGKEWVGLCKNHNDTHPSAYLVTSKIGNVYAGCHVCGPQNAEAVSRALGVWFDPAQNIGGSKTNKKATCIDANITAIYEYRDAQGNVAYESVRYEETGKEKTFKQRVPDGNGQYQWSTKGTTRYPFRLPELLAAPLDQWVFIPEGEKDVNNLVKNGFVATCNVGGAAKGNWRKEYNTHFTGRKVAILPDNDEPGVKHGEEVAQNLSGIAAKVRIVTLPNLPAKGDVSDWFAAGGTVDELKQLVDLATDYVAQPVAQTTTSSVLTVSEMIEAFASKLGHLAQCDLDDRLYLNGRPASDTDLAPLEIDIHDYNGGIHKGETSIPIGAIKPVVLRMAARNHFHPVRDWLSSLAWDGDKHILNLSKHFVDAHDPIDYGNGANGSVFQALLARWLIGACKRAFEGTQNPVLILAGMQGIGKSYLPAWLAAPLGRFHGYNDIDGNPFFCEGSIEPDSIDHQRRLTNNFVWEVGEIGGTMRKADQDALKQFLTRKASTFRVPYGRFDLTKPVLCNWIATVNPSVGFLTDSTGNRRFRTVEVTDINWAYSKTLDANQVWAQAMDFYRRGYTVELSEPERIAVEGINHDHEATTNEEEAILAYYDIDTTQTGDDWRATTKDVSDFLIAHVHSCRHSKGVTPVGLALSRLTGRPTKRERIDGKRVMCVRGVKPNAAYYSLKPKDDDNQEGDTPDPWS